MLMSFKPFLTTMGMDGTSDDECDDVQASSCRVDLSWRDEVLTLLLRDLDRVAQHLRLCDEVEASNTQGCFDMSSPTSGSAPCGLPINFYDSRFLEELSEDEVSRLELKSTFDLASIRWKLK